MSAPGHQRHPVVLVLAGGVSNRFWPLEDKPFFPFAGTCLLERHLRLLRDIGCERFVVVVRPGMETRAADLGPGLGVAGLKIATQHEEGGMAGALLAAAPVLEAFGQTGVYVTQAQDVVDAAMHRSLLEEAAARPDFALLAASRVRSYFPGGYLAVEGGHITSIVEKPEPGAEPGDLVNIVAHYFSSWRHLVDRVRAEFAYRATDDAYERGLGALMKTEAFRPVIYEGRWEALKYPWQVLDVMDMLMAQWSSGREPLPPGYELREDGVIMGRDVRIFPGSHVVAPALVGHGAVIGHNALVRGSMVGERTVVGFGSEVARSYVGEGVELHHNYVGDSVMAAGSSMGFGATTANFRLDGRTVPSVVTGTRIDSGREKLGAVMGQGAKLGVNTSLMPGVKIGAGAIVGPNLRITRDVPAGERVLYDDDYGRF